MEILRRIFKRKPKAKEPKVEDKKRTYTKLKDHGTDISFENEIKKPVEKETKETKETKSSLTFGD
jgi:hypothetical protein